MDRVKNRSLIVWGAVGGGSKEGLPRARGSLEETVMFIVSMVVRVSEVYTKVKIHQVINSKYVQVILYYQ